MTQGTRAPAHVRHAPCAWVASATTSRVVSEAMCAQRRGVSRGCACHPPSLSRPPFPRPSPRDLPEVVPYPILGRLSSTRQRRAAPRSAGLPDLVTSRSIRRVEPAVRHRTRHASWAGGGPRNGEGLSAAPDAPAPRCASGSVGVLRREATGSPAGCQTSIPPVRTETVGKRCSRTSSAARTERPSVVHTITRGRPRWGTSSLRRPSRAGKGSTTAPSMCLNAPAHASGLRTSRTRVGCPGTAACVIGAGSAAVGGASGG